MGSGDLHNAEWQGRADSKFSVLCPFPTAAALLRVLRLTTLKDRSRDFMMYKSWGSSVVLLVASEKGLLS